MEIETIFGFSLCVVPLQVVPVVYFRRVYGKLRELRPPEGGEVCHC